MKCNPEPNSHMVDELPVVFKILDVDKKEHYEVCNFIVGYDTYSGLKTDHKYLMMERETWGRKQKRYVCCRLFYSRSDKSQGYGIGIDGTDPPIFFKFADCEHDYSRTNLGRCYNRYTCTTCGDNYTVDSSD